MDQVVKLWPDLLFFPVGSPIQVIQKMRWKVELCLADLWPIDGFTRAPDHKGGANVKEMRVQAVFRGLRAQWMENTEAFPCCDSVWTWQAQSAPHMLCLVGCFTFVTVLHLRWTGTPSQLELQYMLESTLRWCLAYIICIYVWCSLLVCPWCEIFNIFFF